MSRALTALMRQSRGDIVFSPGSVDARQAPALYGRLTPGEALTRLLAGSGLEFQMIEPGGAMSFVRGAQALLAEDFLQTWLTSNGASYPAVPSRVRGVPPSRSASGGAVYGLGAVNGVVNLVLDRDYRGAEVAATAGARAQRL